MIFTRSRCANHGHDAASSSSLLNLFLGETFKILADSANRRVVGEISVIDEDKSGFRVVAEIIGMQAVDCRCKFDQPRGGKNLEDATAVRTIIRDLEFLTQLVEGENVR